MTVSTARQCGSCTLCCKVYEIPELAKPAGRWCPSCKPGRGCSAYAERPRTCIDFACEWLANAALGPDWRPDTARFVIARHDASGTLQVTCDIDQPLAWRRDPYERQIRQWARELAPRGIFVLVFHRGAATLLRPDDEDLFLGVPGPGGIDIRFRTVATPAGPRVEIRPASAA